jgi:hypothetical protein
MHALHRICENNSCALSKKLVTNGKNIFVKSPDRTVSIFSPEDGDSVFLQNVGIYLWIIV